jgi:hypothetical protein
LLQLSGHKQQFFFVDLFATKPVTKVCKRLQQKNLVLIATKLNYNFSIPFFYNKLKKAFQQTNFTNSTNLALIIAKSNNQHYNFSVHNFFITN